MVDSRFSAKPLSDNRIRFWHGFGIYFCVMNRKTTIIVLSLAAQLAAPAQQRWSLDDCIGYALKHANEVRRQKVEQRQAGVDYRTAVLDFLPTVSAQANGQYSWGRNIDPETNIYNTVATFNNYYGISASMQIFDGGQTWNAFRLARLAKNAAPTAVQKAKDDKAIDVMQKFVDAVYTLKSIAIMEKKLADSKALLAKTRRLYELGEKSRPDVAQMESQTADDDYNLTHQQNLARTALLALKSAMNFPTGDTLRLDTLVSTPTHAAPADGTVSPLSVDAKPAVILADNAAEQARVSWKLQRAALLPQIYLSGGVSTSYYKTLSSGWTGQAFRQQMRNNLGEYVSLTLSVPLFSPGGWRSIKRAKADYVIARLNADDTRRKMRDAAEQALADYEGCLKETEKMARKAAADSLAYHTSRRKYEEGMLSTFDLQQSSQALLASRVALLRLQMVLAVRLRLVNYYINNEPLWTSN